MTLDILIYAVIAVLLLWRLWVVLGRRNEEDAARPNPFDAPPVPPAAVAAAPAVPPAGDVPVLKPIFNLAPTSLDGGIAQIRALDPAFDEREFLRQARIDFAEILGAFATGDLTPCAARLGPAVRRNFDAAIAARAAAGQILQNRITRIVDVETAAARADGSTASLTVRFVTEQENILIDAEQRVIGGARGQIEQLTDLWRFSRDTALAGGVWQLVETMA